MDEVLLRDAKMACLGHPRDEAICRDVAKAMLGMGRRPLIAEKSRVKQVSDGLKTSGAVDRARRLHRDSLEESGRHGLFSDDSESNQTSSDDDVLADFATKAGLREAMAARASVARPSVGVSAVVDVFKAKRARGVVEALPLFQEDPRREAK